jgi:pre-60S factor REI1
MQETVQGTPLTCISCRLLFATAKEQREHYKEDLHCFNLKRKVAQLPPVSKEVFQEKLKSMQYPNYPYKADVIEEKNGRRRKASSFEKMEEKELKKLTEEEVEKMEEQEVEICSDFSHYYYSSPKNR